MLPKFAQGFLSALTLMLISGCALLFPEPAITPEEGRVGDVPFEVAWTAVDSIVVANPDGGHVYLPVFTRVDVLGIDQEGLRIGCVMCEEEGLGGVVVGDQLLHTALYPQPASYGSLADFALAVRRAAERGQLELLRSVMASDFTYSFVGPQTRDAALQVWRSEDFAALSEVPSLLDEGLGTTDGRIWSAPRAYRTDLAYRGYRIGFRRNEVGRWEWLYLIRGISP